MVSEAGVERTIEAFRAAAVSSVSWFEPLAALAELTGSKHAQLSCIGPGSTRPFHWLTNACPEMLADFAAVGGADPRVNPRARSILRAPVLQLVEDGDGGRVGPPDYRAWVDRHDVPHICMAPLLQRGPLLIGMSVVRGRRQGAVDSAARRAFSLVARHARAAVEAHLALDAAGAKLVGGSLGALGKPAFVCDAYGGVISANAEADDLLRGERRITARQGRLVLSDASASAALASALAAAGSPLAPGPTFVVVGGVAPDAPLLLEVVALPKRSHGLGYGAAALVLVRQPGARAGRLAVAAQALYGLTPTETTIVAELLAGRAAQAIAGRTGTSVGTVRTHIRHVYDKVGVRSQLELVAALEGVA